MTYEIDAGVLSVAFQRRPSKLKMGAVFAGGILLTLALVYAYAVMLPQYVGFETAVLVGLGYIALVIK